MAFGRSKRYPLFEWIERWFSMRSVTDERERAPLVSAVSGAEHLRDALVFLRIELESLGIAKPNVFNRSIADIKPAPSALRDEIEFEDSSVLQLMRDVSAAAKGLAEQTRAELVQRGVDVDALVQLRERRVPISPGDRGALHAQVEGALAAFTHYDYEQRTG